MVSCSASKLMCRWNGRRMDRAAHISTCQLIALSPLFDALLARLTDAEATIDRISDQQIQSKAAMAAAEVSSTLAHHDIERLRGELKAQKMDYEHEIQQLRTELKAHQSGTKATCVATDTSLAGLRTDFQQHSVKVSASISRLESQMARVPSVATTATTGAATVPIPRPVPTFRTAPSVTPADAKVGDALDVKDTAGKWLAADVQTVTNDHVVIKYRGWGEKWNENILRTSDRLASHGTHTTTATASPTAVAPPPPPTVAPPAVPKSATPADAKIGDLLDVKDTAGNWLVAEVKSITNDQVFVKYRGWEDKWNEHIARTSDRLASHGTHSSKPATSAATVSSPTAAAEWTASNAVTAANAKVGDFIDALDTDGRWCICRVTEADKDKIKVHFIGWAEKWNESLSRTSDRLAPRLSKTGHVNGETSEASGRTRVEYQRGLIVGASVDAYDESKSVWRAGTITSINPERTIFVVQVTSSAASLSIHAKKDYLLPPGTGKVRE